MTDRVFQEAADWLTTSPAAAQLSTEGKLELYGLFKVVHASKPDGARPSFFNPTARAKYDAWVQQAGMYEAEGARDRYIEIAKQLGWAGEAETATPKGMGVSVSRPAKETDIADETLSDMHKAVIDNDLERVACLLKDPTHLADRDDFGNTPLHLAADRGLEAMVSLLLSHGADRDLTDVDLQTPLDLALLTGREGIATMLRRKDK